MKNATVQVGKLHIPTYPEPPAEEMPMFAENRVHQRSSGRPYPNKVVMQVDRRHKEEREYTVVTLENDYVRIEILPEIGGRIYSALDKTTGYDFFYKQHVIKPALIGVLGSWISGGVEFNWPFHHRASGFMPCDFKTEQQKDGTVICWLSEHDPVDRMKGMVGIVLRPDCAYFETRMRLYNRTDTEHSFLWWENAAVPVNEQYQIFFPADVSYVNFHYLKSRTTYPIAGNGVFNGIPMQSDRDISWHKNTREATSYFAAASDYDFFGGYDHGKQCGVVHIGDHHVSPGKKMFTWAYGQLAKSWENALTDTDGQYAELMAGSYSDNQPNFSWLAPYETKQFSQYWYPISRVGAPTFANLNCALRLDKENSKLYVQATARYENARVRVLDGERVLADTVCDLDPTVCAEIACGDMPSFVTVDITCGGKTVAYYQEKHYDKFVMPEVITDMPSAAGMNSAEELYLAGVHVDQYRDPAVNPDAYWTEALKRDIHHIPSLIAMAGHEYNRYALDSAEQYALHAIERLNLYNERHRSGEAYYVYGKILEAKGETDRAYDYYHKAAWAADAVARAMTRIAVLDIKRGEFQKAAEHAQTALDYGRNNSLAVAVWVIAQRELGNSDEADARIREQLTQDPLDHTMRYLAGQEDLYAIMDSDAAQTCLDIAFDFIAMGRYGDCIALLKGVIENGHANKMVYYTRGYATFCAGLDGAADYVSGSRAPLGVAYPVRLSEKCVLEDVIGRTGNADAKMLLGCLLYNKRQYTEAAALWEDCDDYIATRNLAVAYFSHLNKPEEAFSLMQRLLAERPDDEELLYETVCLMDKMSAAPEDKIRLMRSHTVTRDDILTELAKAYNQAFMPDEALKVLLSHAFVPCEGGEHAIADQYMFAYLVKGNEALEQGEIRQALEFFREGQVLPQSLGAGIWNHCKRIPLKFHEAICLERLGENEQAKAIFRYIADTEIEYFSNMHLKELPYYQALAHDRLGDGVCGQQLITKYRREWDKIKQVKDNGYFATTPFFIPFVDAPEKLRRAQWLYLTGLCEAYRGNSERARAQFAESVQLNTDNMFALFYNKYA